jgi:tripartite-type tricarboxylate transporter receptor subunit TctC
VKSGRLKALGLMSSARHPVLPEVPTLGEQGIAGFNTDGWLGLFAPKGIPAPVLASIKHTLNEIVRSDEYQKRVVQLGYAVPPPATLDDFPGFIASEFRVWTPRVEDSGAKLE